MSKKRTVDVHLGYFKQGDDMHHSLENTSNPEEAFRFHATSMVSVSKHLNKVADMIRGHKIEVFADTHCINITCDEDLAQKLIDAEVACKDPMEDEMDEEDDDQNEDDQNEDDQNEDDQNEDDQNEDDGD